MSRDVERFRHFLKAGMPGPHAYVVLLGLTRFDFPGVIENIEKGLPYSAFERLQRNTAFSTDQLLIAVLITAGSSALDAYADFLDDCLALTNDRMAQS